MDSDNPVSGVINWQFLNEPLYRWALFFFAVGAMGFAWDGVLRIMKE